MNAFVNNTKKEQLERRMASLEIRESDLTERFVLGAGRGGQKVNKTASCVYLCHVPTGMEVKCQATRSRALNRYYARKTLCDRLEAKLQGEQSRLEQQRERIRRQKRRRTRRQRARMLEDKRHHGTIKQLRKSVDIRECD